MLDNILAGFPELLSFFAQTRRGTPVTGVIPDTEASLVGATAKGVDAMTGTTGGHGIGEGIDIADGSFEGEHIDPTAEKTERGTIHEGRRKRPAVMIGFKDDPSREELGWLEGNTIVINRGHPSYGRASMTSLTANLHVTFSVACILSNCVCEKSPQKFISQFLASWGKAG